MCGRRTVPANKKVDVSWGSSEALPRRKAKPAGNGVYLSVDVCAEANQAFHQRNVAINGCQVETVVS